MGYIMIKINASRCAVKVASLTNIAIFSLYPQVILAKSATYGPVINQFEQPNSEPANDKNYRLVDDFSKNPPHGMNRVNVVNRLEVVYQMLNILDAAQTASCMRKPNCHERNPILGKRPSDAAVIGFKTGIGVLHYGASRWLLKRNPDLAVAFEGITIVVQGVTCGLNFRHAF